MSDLKPCPFCGQEPVMSKWGADTWADCDHNYTLGGSGISMTAEHWNARPIEDALQKRIDELESENKALRLIAGSHSMSEVKNE